MMVNDKIFELAKKADLIGWDKLPSGAITPDHESVVNARKFGELLLNEVLAKIDEVGYKASNNISADDTELFKTVLKQHFGK
jgi:hypothetical protein